MSLPYDLALRLKKAGWKQDYSKGLLNGGFVWENDDPDGDIAYSPTLEELVDACGEGFFKLIRQENDQWFAGDESNKIYGTGSTPLIAVAHLYLALNEKVDNPPAKE